MVKKHTKIYNIIKRTAAAALALLLTAALAACGTVTDDVTTPGAPAGTSSPTVSGDSHITTAPQGSEADGTATAEPEETLNIPENTIDAAQAIIYDIAAKRTLFSRNGVIDGKVYPASTTKLFTAWVALQYLSPDDVITAGDELTLVASDASIAYVRRGHKLTAAMLVEGMLLPSGGDAAYVIAAAAGKKIRGNDNISAEAAIAAFVGEMNRRLEALGMTGTHFTNPDGYHDPEHYTTLEDIARIGALALENETIMKYATLASDRVTYASGQSNKWQNTNELIRPDSLYYCADAIGLKTGSTDEAGYCVMTAARNAEGKYYIIGVFGGSTGSARFADAAKLIDYALGRRS